MRLMVLVSSPLKSSAPISNSSCKVWLGWDPRPRSLGGTAESLGFDLVLLQSRQFRVLSGRRVSAARFCAEGPLEPPLSGAIFLASASSLRTSLGHCQEHSIYQAFFLAVAGVEGGERVGQQEVLAALGFGFEHRAKGVGLAGGLEQHRDVDPVQRRSAGRESGASSGVAPRPDFFLPPARRRGGSGALSYSFNWIGPPRCARSGRQCPRRRPRPGAPRRAP